MLKTEKNIESLTAWYRPLRTVLVYGLFGALWILFSDMLLFKLFSDKELIQKIAMIKGWVYISVTAILLYFLINRDLHLLLSTLSRSLQSEETFRKIFDGNPLAAIIIDIDSQGILNCNDAAVALYGYEKEELLGQPIALLLDPKYTKGQKVRRITLFQLSGKDKHRKKDDSLFTAELYYHRISLENNETILLLVKDVTEENRNRDLLRESENRYKLVTQLVSDFIYSCIEIPETGYQVDWITSAFYSMTGYTEAELFEKHCWSFIVLSEDKHLFNELVDEFELGKTNMKEFRIATKTGDMKWLRTYVSYVEENPETGFRRIYGAAQDITERRLARVALSESEQKYRLLFERTRDAVFVLDRVSGHFIMANESAELLTGRSIEELKQLKASDITLTGAAERSSKSGLQPVPALSEVQYVRPDGEVRTALLDVILVDENTAFGIAKDITEAKKIASELEESKYFLMKSQEVAHIGSYVFDVKNDRWISSPNLDTIFGIPASYEKSAESWLNIIHPDDIEMMQEHLLGHVLSHKKPFDKEYRIIRLDDKVPRWVWGLGELEMDSAGNPVRMIGTIQDITERKNAESSLILAKEKAEEMNRLKSNFLANMSHELRTPLNGIMGFSELLVENASGDEQRMMAETIHRSGRRLLNTLNLILNLSKIEANKQEIHLIPIELNELVTACVGLYDAYAKSRKITIAAVPFTHPLLVVSDRQMLDSILNNLISNAIKYTTEGGVTVSVSDKGSVAGISIRDTGIGISEEGQQIIFDAFRQVSEGFGRAFEGTGLGLTITKRYIELLGGKIDLESTPGKGSTFTITLPLAAQAVEVEPEHIPLPAGNLHPEKKFSAILVDDDESVEDLVTYILKDFVKVDYTKDVQTAVTMMLAKNYDVALIDISLQNGQTGLDILNAIHTLPHYKQSPLIAFTAYAMAGDKEEFLSYGFTHYISKPFTKGELRSLLMSVLTKE